MAETETTEHQDDADEKAGEEDTDTSKNKDGAEGDDTDEGDDATDDKKADDEDASDEDDEDADDKGGKDDKKSKKPASKDEKDEEPPTRKRPVFDFIKERQSKKGGSDKSKKEDEGGDDDIDEEDERTIGKVVEKALKPILDDRIKAEDEADIAAVLKDNPELKPFEAKARKYMAHPSRKDVPIEEIFYAVAGKELMRIGAKRAKIADDEAKKTKSAGGNQDAGGAKTAATMSREELEAKQNEVRLKMADR